MSLTDLLKSFTRASVFGVALYACGGEEKEGCQNDYDCREPRVCVSGYCQNNNGSNNYGSEDETRVDNSACNNSPFNNRYLSDISICDSDLTYFFDAETCMVGTSLARNSYRGELEYSGNELGACRFIQNFSCSDVNNYPERCDNYQCALSKNENLFIESCDGGVSLHDNLWMRAIAPVDLTDCERTRKEPWYETCFGTGEP